MSDSSVISDLIGETITDIQPLAGGDIADVMLVSTTDGQKYVIKRPRKGQQDTTATEAAMLRLLADKSALPVPKVITQQNRLLIMRYIDHTGGSMSGASAIDGARHIAALHALHSDRYGLDFETVIGPLKQKNTPEESWIYFYAEHRLRDMALRAHEVGMLPTDILQRIEKFTEKLGDYIPDKPKASLLHGDLWGGNILVDDDHVAAFIDPALYYGHAEMDLAFLTLFGSAGDDFFAAYNEINPIEAGFFKDRRAIYNLWPLLVHVHLFGGTYVGQIKSTLDKFGV